MNIEIDDKLYQLLNRCAAIEKREMADIIFSHLNPYLERYTYESLEQWESAREINELTSITQHLENIDTFDPNHIPFDKQIMALRQKLDEIDRDIKNGSQSSSELEKLRYTLVKDLNFAESEALKKEQLKRTAKSNLWKKTCQKLPLEEKHNS